MTPPGAGRTAAVLFTYLASSPRLPSRLRAAAFDGLRRADFAALREGTGWELLARAGAGR